jgi:adenosine kinase
MTGMRLGLAWDVAGCIGSLAATYVLEEHGTQRHHYSVESFSRRYRETFGDTLDFRLLLGHPQVPLGEKKAQAAPVAAARSPAVGRGK